MNHIPQIKLYRPDGAHKSFRLYRVEPNGDFIKLPSEELQIVNDRLKKKLISIEEASKLAEKIKESKVRERDRNLGIVPLLFTSENDKVLNEYEKTYRDRNIKEKSKDNRLTKMKRALGSLQGLSITVASRSEMTQKLTKMNYSPGTYNEMVGCLNSLLKWQGRNVQLFKVTDEGEYIRFIGKADFKKLEFSFNHNERLLMRSGFATGMRYGENLGAEKRRVKVNLKLDRIFYHVERQWNVHEQRYTLPKRGKKRDTVVMQDFEDSFKEFLSLSFDERLEAGYRLGERIRARAMELWPKDEDKHVCFQDLRHSYATQAIANGISLSHVARFLGNGLKVTEDYYASYAFSDEIYSLPSF